MADPLKEKKDKLQKRVHTILINLNAVEKGTPFEIERYYENNMKYGMLIEAVRAAGFRNTRDLLESNSFPAEPGVRLFTYNGTYYEAVLYNQALKDQFENVVSQSKNKEQKESKNKAKYTGNFGPVRGVRGGIRGGGSYGAAFRTGTRGRGGGAPFWSRGGGHSNGNSFGGNNNNGGFNDGRGRNDHDDRFDNRGGNNGSHSSANFNTGNNYDDGYSNNGGGGRNDDRWQRDRSNEDYGRGGGGGYSSDEYGPSPTNYQRSSSPPGMRRSNTYGRNRSGGGGGLFGDREPTPPYEDGRRSPDRYYDGGRHPPASPPYEPPYDRRGGAPPGLPPQPPRGGVPPGLGHDEEEEAPRRSAFARPFDTDPIRPASVAPSGPPPGFGPSHPPGLGPLSTGPPPGIGPQRTSDSDTPSTSSSVSAFKPVVPPQVRGIEMSTPKSPPGPAPGLELPPTSSSTEASKADKKDSTIQLRTIVEVLALHLARFQPDDEKEMPAEKIADIVNRFFGYKIKAAVSDLNGLKLLCEKIERKDSDKFLLLHKYDNDTKLMFSLRSSDDKDRIIARFGHYEEKMLELEAAKAAAESKPIPETPSLIELRKTLEEKRSEEPTDEASIEQKKLAIRRIEMLIRIYELFLREKAIEITITEIVERLQIIDDGTAKAKALVGFAYHAPENQIFDSKKFFDRDGKGTLLLRPHAMIDETEPLQVPPVSSIALPEGLRNALESSEYHLDDGIDGELQPSSTSSSTPSNERPPSQVGASGRAEANGTGGDVHGFSASEIHRERTIPVPNRYHASTSNGDGSEEQRRNSAGAGERDSNLSTNRVEDGQRTSPFVPISPAATPSMPAESSGNPTASRGHPTAFGSGAFSAGNRNTDNSAATQANANRGLGQQQEVRPGGGAFGSRGSASPNGRSTPPRAPPTPDGSPTPPSRFSVPSSQPQESVRPAQSAGFGGGFGSSSFGGSTTNGSSNDYSSTSRSATAPSDSGAAFGPTTSSSAFTSSGATNSEFIPSRTPPQSEFVPHEDDRPSWHVTSSPSPAPSAPNNYSNPDRNDGMGYGSNNGQGFDRDNGQGYSGNENGFGRNNDQGYGRDDSNRNNDQGYGRNDQGNGRNDGQGYGRNDQDYGRNEQGYGNDNNQGGFSRNDDQGYGRDDRNRNNDQGYGRDDDGYGKQGPPPGMGFDREPPFRPPSQQQRDDHRNDDGYRRRRDDDLRIPREPEKATQSSDRHELIETFRRGDRHRVRVTMHDELRLFYVRLLDDEDRFQRMQRDLNDLYKEEDRAGRLPRFVYLERGDRMALYDRGRWHRVQIEALDRDPRGQKSVRFLDIGETLRAEFDPNDLVPLAPRFARIPPFALCCSVEKFATVTGKRSELRDRESRVFGKLLDAEPGQVELIALDAFNSDTMMEVRLEYFYDDGMERIPDYFEELGLIQLDRAPPPPFQQQHQGFARGGGPPGF